MAIDIRTLGQRSPTLDQPVTGQPGVVPATTFPQGSGGCIVGNGKKGVYRIVNCRHLGDRMSRLISQTPFPLEVAAWFHGSYAESKHQQDHLRWIFRGKCDSYGWYSLSAADLAVARAYLAGEKELRAQEAERVRQQAESARAQAAKAAAKAVDECLLVIHRLRMLAGVVRSSVNHEVRAARSSWPPQQATDDCLSLIGRFHSAAEKFDGELARLATEIQLGRMPKHDAAHPLM